MQRSIDLTLAVLASVVSMLLSLPYWRSFSYWAESRIAGWIYFAVGFVLAIYVFYVFFRALRTMFVHEGHHAAHHHAGQHTHEHLSEHAHQHGHEHAQMKAPGQDRPAIQNPGGDAANSQT